MIPGTENELNFWRDFVKSDRCKEWAKNEPNHELEPFIREFIEKNCPKDGFILDCGSGVISILHGLGYFVHPTDLLGKEYEILYDYSKTEAFVPEAVPAEEISYISSFDIVHMRNALDHCQQPSIAYEAMLRAVKPGGYLIIHGFANEATAEGWRGMHQWDIDVQDGGLHIRGKGSTFHYYDPEFSSKYKLKNGKEWITWVIKKK